MKAMYLCIFFLLTLCICPVLAEVTAAPSPSIDPVADPGAVASNSGPHTVSLTGISDNNGNLQGVTVTATSSHTSLVPNPTVNLPCPTCNTATLTYTPAGSAGGTAVITVRVANASFASSYTDITFTVTVTGLGTAILSSTNDSEGISIYPNPTNGALHIDLSNEQAISKISLFNVMGENIKEFDPATVRQTISLDGLDNAIYYVVVLKTTGERLVKSIRKL